MAAESRPRRRGKTIDLLAQETLELLSGNTERADVNPAHLISGSFARTDNDGIYRTMLRYVARSSGAISAHLRICTMPRKSAGRCRPCPQCKKCLCKR